MKAVDVRRSSLTAYSFLASQLALIERCEGWATCRMRISERWATRPPSVRGGKIVKTVVILGLMVSQLWAGIQSQPASRTAASPAPVEVRLLVPTTQRRVGQAPIHIRVELWNKGKEDFIAGSELAPIMNARAYLALEFLDNKGNLHQDPGISENFSEKGLNEWWTRIAPGHYYGVEFDLDPYTFPFLETPGTYKMVAKYVSKGGLTASIANPDSLSYRVWEGSITSNSVSLETLAPKK